MDLMVWKYRFGNERYIKQVNDLHKWQKKTVEKGYVCRESGFTTQGRREVEIGTRLLGNDKNNVIVNKVLSYF